ATLRASRRGPDSVASVLGHHRPRESRVLSANGWQNELRSGFGWQDELRRGLIRSPTTLGRTNSGEVSARLLSPRGQNELRRVSAGQNELRRASTPSGQNELRRGLHHLGQNELRRGLHRRGLHRRGLHLVVHAAGRRKKRSIRARRRAASAVPPQCVPVAHGAWP
ncbi:MAG: hypothetical protein JWO86_8981, partial [Myxococcaceae bacterium]|nr:hypothetical protein [Myxococcaceae bacterium]